MLTDAEFSLMNLNYLFSSFTCYVIIMSLTVRWSLVDADVCVRRRMTFVPPTFL